MHVYGTQAARKIDSFNLKMRLENIWLYSLAALLLPLAGKIPRAEKVGIRSVPVWKCSIMRGQPNAPRARGPPSARGRRFP